MTRIGCTLVATSSVLLSVIFTQAEDKPKPAVQGLVESEPASGFFVKTDKGYMVAYKATIPGSKVEFEMVPVPGGKFKFGSPASEANREANEGPQIEVTVEPFWMSKYETTYAEFSVYVGMYKPFAEFQNKKLREPTPDKQEWIVTIPSQVYDPQSMFGTGKQPRAPAMSMTQFSAKQYTKWLSRLTGQFYRLPWEAEWEYACRAGSTTAYCFGDDLKQLSDYAWTRENSNESVHEVGLKKPNAWGLYDMHGNVAEWCLDELKDDARKPLVGKTVTVAETAVWPKKLYPRVIKGGDWDDDAKLARSAARIASNDKEWLDTDPDLPKGIWWFSDGMVTSLGMRIMRPLTEPAAKDQLKFWEADHQTIVDGLKARLESGRGKQGLVDPDLPAEIEKLLKEGTK